MLVLHHYAFPLSIFFVFKPLFGSNVVHVCSPRCWWSSFKGASPRREFPSKQTNKVLFTPTLCFCLSVRSNKCDKWFPLIKHFDMGFFCTGDDQNEDQKISDCVLESSRGALWNSSRALGSPSGSFEPSTEVYWTKLFTSRTPWTLWRAPGCPQIPREHPDFTRIHGALNLKWAQEMS